MTSIYSNNGDGQTSPNPDANKPEDDRKLFVGGLTWDTTQDDLREYFSNFGNILDCSIKHDPTTGRSRGFAFLVFDRKDIVDKILSQSEHFVKGRKVDPKPAHRRLAMTGNNNNNVSSSSSSMSNNNRKVFIGGLDPNFPDVQLREYFSQFGTIDEIDLPYDKEKNERRPFCFISFQNEQSAQEVLRLQRHTIGDITVDVKRAKPKTLNNQQQQMYDPYGQQSTYANYGSGVTSYGGNAYSAADPYAAWNAYPYNQQVNSTAYSYGGSGATGAPNPGTSSYSQYSQHQPNSQYSYGPSSTGNANEYYSQYGYSAPQVPSAAYGGAAHDYNSYYASMATGANGSIVDNGAGQQAGNSPNEANNYDHDKHYGKAKPSIVSSPNYHTYPLS
jgi:squid-like protein